MISIRTIALPTVFLVMPAIAAAETPVGSEFRLDTRGAGGSWYGATEKSVTMTPSGRFVAAWPYGFDTMARVFSPSGRARLPEFPVNTSTGSHVSQAVAAADDGSFVLVWSTVASDGYDRVLGRLFDPQGVPRGGEFQVTAPTNLALRRPAVGLGPTGAFVVAWEPPGIFARRYDASGAPLGAEFQVTSSTAYLSGYPAVAVAASGEFVVVWGLVVADPVLGELVGRRFAPNGAPLGPPFAVDPTTLPAGGARIAMAGDGSFVVAWSGGMPGDGNGTGVGARRFSATGAPVGAGFLVNVFTTGSQHEPDLAVDAAGDFVIAWTSDWQDGSDAGVFARRFDAAGIGGPEFQVPNYTTGNQGFPSVANDSAGNFIVTWVSERDGGYGRYAQRFAAGLMPAALAIDPAAGPASDGNGVLEAGETVVVAPSWLNAEPLPHAFTGSGTAFTGPGTSTYAVVDGTADYGAVAAGTTASCTATGNCFAVRVTVPAVRPFLHWDAVLREDLAPASLAGHSEWTVHVGDSFRDVPRSSPYYRFVEALLHHHVTGGCSGDNDYCPATPIFRADMSVMVLAAKEGGYLPPTCTPPGRFADLPSSNSLCPWIEELARRGVVGGCGGGNFCPYLPVSRQEMAVFVLATKEPGLQPPACALPAMFDDVPASSPFCPWIEELARRGVVGGCGGSAFCPAAPVTREQMAVFLTVTFGLPLYGP